MYNELGQVNFIISPKGVAELKSGSWSFSQNIKDNYTYQFVYDALGRIIEKKVPGQAWMYYGYDDLNRLVLAQDGLMRANNKWIFIKYDRQGRAVMQGLYRNITQTSRTTIQTMLNGLYFSSNATYGVNAWYEQRGTTLHGYTNISFPKTNSDNSALEILSVNYYDTHDFDFNGTNDYSYTVQSLAGENTPGRNRGLPTGSKRLILGSTT